MHLVFVDLEKELMILYADDLQWWLIRKRIYRKHCNNGVTPLENMASE